jgi:hypothetical protein
MANRDEDKRSQHQQTNDNSEYSERQEHSIMDTNKEIISEKMQKPEPWPEPPSEDSGSKNKITSNKSVELIAAPCAAPAHLIDWAN